MLIWITLGISLATLIMKIIIAIMKFKKQQKYTNQELIEEIEEEDEYYNEPILVSAYTVDLSEELKHIQQLTMKEEDKVKILEEDTTII